MIKTINLQKIFKTEEVETWALNNVSIEVKQGEFVAIMGPSGCGKSTLLNILGLLDNPTGGEYYLNGTEVSKYTESQRTSLRKGVIGFVFQSFNLIDELNVYEDILRFMRNTSPMFFVDMKRHYPRVNDKYENDKECHKQAMVDLLKEGVGEGVIRADINMEIVATLLTFQFELLKKSDRIFNSKYTFTEIFETIFKSFIRGIATPEGVKYTDEFFEENR